MGNLFNKIKATTSSSSSTNSFDGRQYKDEDKVEVSGIQYTTGVVIADDDGYINVLAESFKDVAFPFHYENNIFKLSKHAKFEVALSHQLRLETYQAVKEWGESDEATDEVTLLRIDPEIFPTAGDYYEDPTIRAIFVKLAKTEGADVTEDVIARGKTLFGRTKR